MPEIEIYEKPKEIDISYFENYGGFPYSVNYQNFTIDAERIVEDLINKGIDFKTILDAGCASGELVRDLRSLGVKAYGIEQNKDILERCVIPQYCVHMSIQDLKNIADDKFDVIYTNSLMYLHPDEIPDILHTFYKVCKKAVYLCCPYLKDSNFRDDFRAFLATKEWWDRKFIQAGFFKLSEDIYSK